MFQKIKAIFISSLLILSIAGCSSQDAPSEPSSQANSTPTQSTSVPTNSAPEAVSSQATPSETESSVPGATSGAEASADEAATNTTGSAAVRELTVHFGDDGAPFTMHLYDNSTAATIAGYVGTADWRLPIYNYDGYDNWEVMQFYDLPSRYEIPANTETITTETAGEVFYSEPNRIVLFYGDGEVTGEYSRVGYFDATEDFISAVQNNPVLEGWGNKIVLIKE